VWVGRGGGPNLRLSANSNHAVTNGGKLRWFVPDGYLPAESSHGVESHEAACVLNVSDEDAHLAFTFYFEDREPIGPVALTVGPCRTRHVRLDDPKVLGGVELPRGVPYAYAVTSDVPVVLQHSRLDTSAGAYTLFTTIAYGE
jgi:hypothetical protein